MFKLPHFILYSFVSRSCPLCKNLESRNKHIETFIYLNCSNKTNGTFQIRLDELSNLLIICKLHISSRLHSQCFMSTSPLPLPSSSALLNLITTIVVFIMFIKVWCNRGKGLKDHCKSKYDHYVCMHLAAGAVK